MRAGAFLETGAEVLSAVRKEYLVPYFAELVILLKTTTASTCRRLPAWSMAMKSSTFLRQRRVSVGCATLHLRTEFSHVTTSARCAELPFSLT
jgi:hypothetical protein